MPAVVPRWPCAASACAEWDTECTRPECGVGETSETGVAKSMFMVAGIVGTTHPEAQASVEASAAQDAPHLHTVSSLQHAIGLLHAKNEGGIMNVTCPNHTHLLQSHVTLLPDNVKTPA